MSAPLLESTAPGTDTVQEVSGRLDPDRSGAYTAPARCRPDASWNLGAVGPAIYFSERDYRCVRLEQRRHRRCSGDHGLRQRRSGKS